jgi:hypothetical protein
LKVCCTENASGFGLQAFFLPFVIMTPGKAGIRGYRKVKGGRLTPDKELNKGGIKYEGRLSCKGG